ncbi:MAG: hypothetical protein HKN16_13290 [Saprospiraceae bacterium]|nr:hypothetical protein [Saprospiraceae bacterium]
MKPGLPIGILIILSFLFYLACTTEPPVQEEELPKFDTSLLHQKWEVHRAFRNGKVAASLDDLFFDFSSKDSMATNLIGQNFKETFQIKKDTIQTTGPSSLFFIITELDSTNLKLETNLRATPFRFLMKRVEE